MVVGFCTECGRDCKIRRRGRCAVCYEKLRKAGNFIPRTREPGEQAQMHLDSIPKINGCWPWPGRIGKNGYGVATLGGLGKSQLAHLWVYNRLVGPVPSGLVIDHTCHTDDLTCTGGMSCHHRRCVNPAHLEPVTFQENMARGRNRNRDKTQCPKGHPYGPPKDSPRGMRRECGICDNERALRIRRGTHEPAHRLPGPNVNARKTHCPRDHEYTFENTTITYGRRNCRACKRERYHERRARSGT